MKNPQTYGGMGILAEGERFELSDGYKPSHDFQSCALDQLSHPSVYYVPLTSTNFHSEKWQTFRANIANI